MRIGHGFDAHKFSHEGTLTLGGVIIPEAPAMLAHSDGDVLLHALCDAILGALAMNDIGHHFPDTDAKWENANSRDLLRHVVSLMQDKDYVVCNADITVLAQKPKLASYKVQMKQNIVSDLNISDEQVNIKATTTEKMGYIGRAEGISVHVVVLLKPTHAD